MKSGAITVRTDGERIWLERFSEMYFHDHAVLVGITAIRPVLWCQNFYLNLLCFKQFSLPSGLYLNSALPGQHFQPLIFFSRRIPVRQDQIFHMYCRKILCA